MRNKRILVIEVAPVRVRSASGEAVMTDQFDVEVTYSPDQTLNENDEALLSDGFSDGTLSKYMILMDDQYEGNATLNSFIDWKKRKGYDVSVVKTSDIDVSGAPTNGQVIAYMQNLPAADYPEYLLVIGDHTADQGGEGTYIVTYKANYGGYSDLYIACRDDSDFIPDLLHGRFSGLLF